MKDRTAAERTLAKALSGFPTDTVLEILAKTTLFACGEAAETPEQAEAMARGCGETLLEHAADARDAWDYNRRYRLQKAGQRDRPV